MDLAAIRLTADSSKRKLKADRWKRIAENPAARPKCGQANIVIHDDTTIQTNKIKNLTVIQRMIQE
jgi:hypothetical protein